MKIGKIKFPAQKRAAYEKVPLAATSERHAGPPQSFIQQYGMIIQTQTPYTTARDQCSQASGVSLGQQYQGAPIPVMVEASLLGRAQGTLNHLDNLESQVAEMRSHLFAEGEPAAKRPSPSSLENMLAEICSRVACLVSETGTINNRLAR